MNRIKITIEEEGKEAVVLVVDGIYAQSERGLKKIEIEGIPENMNMYPNGEERGLLVWWKGCNSFDSFASALHLPSKKYLIDTDEYKSHLVSLLEAFKQESMKSAENYKDNFFNGKTIGLETAIRLIMDK